jgi:hypothetical protein
MRGRLLKQTLYLQEEKAIIVARWTFTLRANFGNARQWLSLNFCFRPAEVRHCAEIKIYGTRGKHLFYKHIVTIYAPKDRS